MTRPPVVSACFYLWCVILLGAFCWVFYEGLVTVIQGFMGGH